MKNVFKTIQQTNPFKLKTDMSEPRSLGTLRQIIDTGFLFFAELRMNDAV